MNEILTTILTIVTTLGGWEMIKYFINRKSNSRIAEAEADTVEFTVLRQTVEFLQAQLQEEEQRFAQQTELLRKANTEILELTKEKGAIELELSMHCCLRKKCAQREPQNGY